MNTALLILGSMAETVIVPGPRESEAINNLGGVIVGFLLTIVIWAALGAAVLALIAAAVVRGKEGRAEAFKWFLVAIVVFALAQGFDVLVPAFGDIVTSPLDVLRR